LLFTVTYNTKTTYPPNYNGTRKTTRKNNGAILKLMAGPHVTTMLSGKSLSLSLSLSIIEVLLYKLYYRKYIIEVILLKLYYKKYNLNFYKYDIFL